MPDDWRILVVDQDPTQREALSTWLRRDGYVVESAGSSDQAVRMARANAYDVCFVDLNLSSGLGGIGTIEALRSARPEVSVIATTACSTVEAAVSALEAGAQEYCVKPCNLPALSRTVERILDLKMLERDNVSLRARLARLEHDLDAGALWSIPANVTLREVERHVIEAALKSTKGNVKAAARQLGIDRSTLYDKVKRYKIPRPEHHGRGAGRPRAETTGSE